MYLRAMAFQASELGMRPVYPSISGKGNSRMTAARWKPNFSPLTLCLSRISREFESVGSKGKAVPNLFPCSSTVWPVTPEKSGRTSSGMESQWALKRSRVVGGQLSSELRIRNSSPRASAAALLREPCWPLLAW